MNYYRNSGNPLANIPDVTKNLIIINVLFFVATYVFSGSFNMIGKLGAFYPDSPFFEPYQIVTHMFMHGGLMHIFFNMFALYMFGSVLERQWGPKRYLFFYLFTGLGAFFLHYLVQGIEVQSITGSFRWDYDNNMFYGVDLATLQSIYQTPVVGASGAIFGLLVGFAMYYPNTPLQIIFIPIPIKAKYFVALYGLYELYAGASRAGDSVAHFAHLGGLLFGWLLIKYWWRNDKKNGNHWYQEY